MKHPKTFNYSGWITLLCFCALAIPSNAATITWTNAAGGNWSVTNNWSPNQVPGAADTAVITNSGTYLVALNTNATVNSMALGGASGQQTLATSGNGLTLNSAGLVSTNGVLQLNGGGLFGSVTVSGQLNWTSGALGGGNTAVTLATNGALVLAGVSGAPYNLGEALTNAGTIYLQSGDLNIDWCGTNYGVINNLPGALVNFQADVWITNTCGGAGFANQGTVRKTGGTGTSFITSVFNNTGTLDAQSGTVALTDGGSLGGVLQAEAGAALNLNGGNFALAATSNFGGAGLSALNGGTLTNTAVLPPNLQYNGGNVIMNLSAPSPGFVVTNANWTVNGTVTNLLLGGGILGGNLTVAGTLTWTNGMLGDSSAAVTVATNGALALAGVNGTDYFLGAYLTNAGTLYLQSGNLNIDWCGTNYGEVVNLPGALVNLQGNVSVDNACGGPGLVNQGTVRKSGGTGAAFINAPFNNNYGLLDVQSGSVAFVNALTLGGVLQAEAAAAIYQTNCTISGAEIIIGTIYSSGGTLAASGSLTISANGVLNLIGGGTFQVEGPLTNNGTVNWESGGVQEIYGSGNNGVIWNQPGAQWNLECNQTLSPYNGAEIFHNAGQLTKSGVSGSTTFNVYLDNTGGTVQAQVGTLQFAVGSNLAGTFQATAGGTEIAFTAGNYSWNGTANFQGNVQLTGGSVTITGGVTSLAASGMIVSNLVNVTGTAWLTNCVIKAAETLAGTVYWAAGAIGPSGSLTVTGTSVLNLIGNATFQIEGPLINNGTVNWLAGGVQEYYGGGFNGVIWNQPGAQWNIECNQTLSVGNGPEVFHNAGELTKSGVSGSTTINVYLDNTGGTVQAQVGTLQFANGSNLAGTFQATAAGAAITFTGGNYNWNGAANFQGNVQLTGGSVTITGGITSLAASGMIISNLVNVTGTAWLTNCVIKDAESLGATVYWAGGALGPSGSLTVTGTGILNVIGNATFQIEGPLTNNGTVNWQAGGLQEYYGGGNNGVIWNQTGAQWNLACNQTLSAGNGAEVFHNAGQLTKSGVSGTTTFNVYLDNAGGTVQAQVGTLQFANGSNLAGTFQATAPGAAIAFTGGNYSWNGTANFQGNVQITGGSVTITSPVASVAASNVTISNLVNVTGTAWLTNCTIRAAENIGGTVNWAAGTLSASGSLTVNGPGVLNLIGNGTFLVEAPLTNNGTVNWLAAGVQEYFGGGNTGVIWNQTGAQWSLECNLALAAGNGPEVFHNAGQVIKSGVSGTTTFNVYLDNTGGTVQAQVGTIQFANGSNLTGTFQATAAGAAIAFTGGNYSWNGTANFQGNVQITGGTVTVVGAAPSLAATSVTISNLVNLTGTAWLTNCLIKDAESIGGTVYWSAGTLSPSGSLTVNGPGVLNLIGSGTFEVEGPLTNNGTVNWLAAGVQEIYGGGNYGVIWNQTGAQWNLECNQTLSPYNGVEIFHNAGQLTKSGVSGTTAINVYLNNSGGTVQVEAGVVALASGQYSLTNGTVDFWIYATNNYGSLNLAGAAPLTGTASVTFGPGFVPQIGNAFTLATYGSHTGSFSALSLPNSVAWTTNYGTTSFALAIANLNATQSIITWTNPAAISYGTPVTTNQLNATANVPGSFAYTPPAGTILTAGSNYLSVLFTPTNTSYNSVFASVVQVVTRVPLAVTASNATRAYGQANPGFAGTLAGVINGDNITANYTCSAVPISPPGAYAIVPNLVDPNNRAPSYIVAATNGVLTVTAGPPPTCVGIAPVTGMTNGGTAVNLTGSGFELGAEVTLGGNSATAVTVYSGTQISAVTPAGPLGPVNVVIINPDGTSATLTNGFSYTGLPPSILTQPTNRLVIQGSNAVFQVSALYASGYQWTFNNGNLTDNARITGAHSNLLTIAGVQYTNGGNYQVLVTNAYGATNSAVAVLTVLATNPPMISGVSATPSMQGCVITWQTDVSAYDQVVYGTATNYTSTNTLSTTLVTSHAVTLSGLTPNTLYHFDLLVFDQNQNQSGDLTFTTLPDTIPPVANLSVVPSTICSLPYTFNWTGSDNVRPTTNLVYAYEVDSQGWSAFGPATSLMVSQLADGQHTFAVEARDAAGNVSIPDSASFYLDTTMPILSELVNTPSDDACVITWQTTEPTEASVNYGPTSAYGQNAASSTLAMSHAITLTNLQAATSYHFQVTAQDGCGRQAVSADIQFNTLAAPDLQVTQVTAPTNVWTGAGFLVSWVDTNAGPGVATGPWVDKVYLSFTNQLNTNTDLLLGAFPFTGTLNPGQSAAQAQLVTVGENEVTNGFYYLSVFTDAGDAVYEVTKTNNSGVSAADLYVNQTPLPALAVSAVNAPTNALGNQLVTVAWTVCNQGNGATDVPLWYDHLYLSPTANIADAIADYGTFVNPSYLVPGACYDQTATVTLPLGVGGNNYFIVKTDSTGLLTQATTSNNIGATTIPMDIQLVTAGFFHVVSVQVAPAPPTVSWPGSQITCTYIVQNAGQSPITGGWDDRITLSSVSNFVNGATTFYTYENDLLVNGPLAPGASYTNSAIFTLPQAVDGLNVVGTWFVVPAVDIHFRAGNGTLGRDELSAPLEVVPPPASDLVVTSVTAPTTAAEAQAINVQWVVANQGVNATSVSTWYDGVYLSTNPVFNVAQSILLASYTHFGVLNLGAVYTNNQSVFIPTNVLAAGASSAINYVFVLTDVGDAVVEITKTNNILAAANPIVIEPATLADLAVLQVQAPPTVVAGATATITWAVANEGASTTSVSNWTDSVYLSPGPTLNPATEVHLADFPHTGFLAPGASYQQSQIVNLPNCVHGAYYFVVFTDSGAQVSEGGATANNVQATAGSSVVWPSQAARLEVSAVTPPASGQAGAPLAVAWTVQNLGNATTATAWNDAVYLSPTPQFVAANSILLGIYPHASALGADASYQQSQSPLVPPCDSGSYYVAVVTDVGEVVNSLTCYTNTIFIAAAPIKVLPGNFASLQVLGLNVPASVNSGNAWPVQWGVTNAGPSAAAGPWTDAVYASLLPTLDTNAFLLGKFTHTNGLASGSSYAQTQSVPFPPCLSGNYNIFVVADVSNAVNVAGCLVDNEAVSTNPITVNYGLHPELVVTAIGNPASATASQSMTVSWSVTNIGLATATGPWVDSVYLAASPVFNPTNSVLLGAYPQASAIPAGGGYSQSTSFTLPNTYGAFYVVVVIDSGGAVQQCQAAGNNVAYSPTRVNVLATLYPDLKVTAVQVPASAYAGQSVNITWIVTNEGTAATPAINWFDALYLSLNQVLESGATGLGTYHVFRSLGVGQSYTNTATVLIPAGLAGPYYVLGLADSGGQLFEHLGYNDSLGFNANPMLVVLPPPADLVATSVSVAPASAVPGTQITLAWNVYNHSSNSIPAAWSDVVYLSTNTVWDLTAVPLATVSHGGVAADTGYAGSWTGPLPGFTPGTYYAILRTDVHDTVNEITLTNNTVTSTGALSVDVPVLTLGQPLTNQLSTGAEQYYKLTAPPGATVKITLTGSVTNAANELYARYQAVPDLGDYDYLYNHPSSADQQVVIPSTGTGWYYVMVRGGNEPGGPLAYTLEANIVPLSITGVSATQIGDNGQVTLTFSGAKFEPGAVIQLVSGTNVYNAVTNMFGDATSVAARFLFTNAVDGLYSVVLINPDHTSTADPQAITIEPAIPLEAEVIPGLVNAHPRSGLNFAWNGAVYNAGNLDIQYLTLVVSDDSGFPIALTPPSQTVMIISNSTVNAVGGCLFTARNLAVGASEDFSFVVSGFGATGFYYYITPTVQSQRDFVGQLTDEGEVMRENILDNPGLLSVTTTNQVGVISTNPLALPAQLLAALPDTNLWEFYFVQAFVTNGVLDAGVLADLPPPTGSSSFGDMLSMNSKFTSHMSCVNCRLIGLGGEGAALGTALGGLAACTAFVGTATAGFAVPLCVGGALLYFAGATLVNVAVFNDCLDNCTTPPPAPCNGSSSSIVVLARSVSAKDGDGGGGDGGGGVCSVSPSDPNELDGPRGYGTPAFVGVQTPWQYTVYFVNESNASAYASLITITNALDPSLDIRTFRVSQVVMGDISISVPTNHSFVQMRVPAPSPNPTNVVVDVTVGVDVVNNDIFCTLNAVDLNTGQSVTSATEGVLPPNTTNNIGQGYLVYSILPKSSVSTGTVVTNQASIVFAPNAPISTDTTTNTVDAIPPTSTVAALAPVQVTTNFVIAWSGTDDLGGSGVGSYDIYFSDNSGPWQAMALGETTNSTTFDGQPGHAYAFYSLAHDNSGNLEQKSPGIEAFTFISSNQPPSLAPVTNQLVAVGSPATIVSPATNAAGGSQSLTYSLLNAPAGAVINATNGTIHWTPTPAQASTTNLFTLQVSNNGIPPLSASASFLAIVGDYAALSLGSEGVLAGQSVCVPLTLVSSAGVTNLNFILTYPANLLGDLSLTPALGKISLQVVPEDASHAQITLQTTPGTSLLGTQQVASVCFTALTNLQSSAATVVVNFSNAFEVDGSTSPTLAASPGTIVVLQNHPFMTVAPGGQGQVVMTLYGAPGTKYVLQSSSSPAGPWATINTYILTGVSQPVTLNDQSGSAMFFRMEQQ